MGLVKNTNFEEFENSVVSACFVPADFDGQSYYVKIQADVPNLPAYRLGSVGDSHGTPELFRLLLPTPLAVGNRGRILSLSNNAIKHQHPSFVAIYRKTDGYNIIPAFYGAPSTNVDWLVATAWLPRPAGATDVDHLDGNPANDALENLEWVTHSQNLRRGRHSRHQNWEPEDQVLMIHEGFAPRLVHPSVVTAIIDSWNGSHVLRRGTRKSANGRYMCLNPTRADAMNFIKNLPFHDTMHCMAAVIELLDSLGIE